MMMGPYLQAWFLALKLGNGHVIRNEMSVSEVQSTVDLGTSQIGVFLTNISNDVEIEWESKIHVEKNHQLSTVSFVQIASSIKVVPVHAKSQEKESNRSNEINMVAKSVQSKLAIAADESHRLRTRISWSTTVFGLSILFVGFVMRMLIERPVFYVYQVGHAGYYCSLIFWGAFLSILSIMPSDTVLIRRVSLALSLVSNAGGIVFLVGAYQTWSGSRLMQKNAVDDPDRYICSEDQPMAGCVLYTARNVVYAFVFIASGLTIWWRALATHKGTQLFDRKQTNGTFLNEDAFKLSPARALERTWWAARWCSKMQGIVTIFFAIAFRMVGDDAPWYNDKHFAAMLFMGIHWTLPGFVFSEHRRYQMMAFLRSIYTQGEAKTAGTIAALLGGQNASATLTLAGNKFRAICFSELVAADFSSNTENENQTNRLFGLTEPVHLGKCDVFLSHSWRDDGQKKFDALSKFAKEFKETHGRDPVIWLDKACVNQKNIANDLLCLPVFLAGCDTLLIIAGPTYTKRLWCILEVFVFLRMGGSIDRIKVMTIDVPEEQTARGMLGLIDVNQCQCYVADDRKKILEIIEQGFETFDTFNELVRNVFRERLTIPPTFAEKQLVLKEAAEASAKQRFRMQMATVGVGVVVFVAFEVMGQLVASGVLDRSKFGGSDIYYSFHPACVAWLFLGMFPNDVVAIRVMSFLGSSVMLLLFIGQVILVASALTNDGEEPVRHCASNLPNTGCVLTVSMDIGTGFSNLLCSVLIFNNLIPSKDVKVWDWSRSSCRFNDCGFKIVAREALQRLWFSAALAFACLGVLSIVGHLALHALGDLAPSHSSTHLASGLMSGVSQISFLLIYKRRYRIATFVASCLSRRGAGESTVLMALLGNFSSSLELATGKFRSISFSELNSVDFMNKTSLFNKAVSTKLGECDGFISYSSLDDSQQQWDALKDWAREFKNKNGREPKLWFGKACIPSTSMSDTQKKRVLETNRKCRPLFAAGCDTLLLMVGPTYTRRLWCVMDLFAFLQAGGSMPRVKILPIGMDEQAARKMFHQIDIRKCECSMDSDRQQFLGAVEQGFGSLEPFNDFMRNTFRQSSASFVSRTWSSKKFSFKNSLKSILFSSSSRSQHSQSSDANTLRSQGFEPQKEVTYPASSSSSITRRTRSSRERIYMQDATVPAAQSPIAQDTSREQPQAEGETNRRVHTIQLEETKSDSSDDDDADQEARKNLQHDFSLGAPSQTHGLDRDRVHGSQTTHEKVQPIHIMEETKSNSSDNDDAKEEAVQDVQHGFTNVGILQ